MNSPTANVQTLFQTAQQQHQNGFLVEAEHAYRQVLELEKRHIGAWHGMAVLTEQLGRPQHSADAHAELGCALIDAGRVGEAETAFRKALELNAQHLPAKAHLSLIFWEYERLDEAQALAQEVVDQQPHNAIAWQTLGLVASKRYHQAEAIAAFEKALAHRPDLILSHNYLGIALNQLGRYDEAMRHYECTLKLQPGNPHAHFNRALGWLAQERFHDGWVDYEWRFRTGQTQRPPIPRPQWDGSPLNGRGLLIHTEQGMGDVLQFIRLLPLIKQQGARIVFACQKPLQKLLSGCDAIDEWFPIDEPGQITFDLHIPLLSLPGLLGITAENCPKTVPYVVPDPERVEHWKPQLETLDGFKIGLGWQGSLTFRGDQLRSIPLKYYQPLANAPNVKFVSLQKSDGLDQLAELQDRFPVHTLEGLDAAGGAFMDTAAVMQHLDLVITSDTALAHLAGALGRPVWLALSTASDWRWFRDRSDSPWYPTMRLFRQKKLGDWEGVFAEMAAELEKQLTSDSPQFAGPRESASPTKSTVEVEIAPGELIDKITILEIKRERIADELKRKHVCTEWEILDQCRLERLPKSPELQELTASLKEINQALWDIEDDIRDCERNQDFGETFIALARAVYKTNDRRAELKRKINELLGSRIVEEKSYAAY